MSINASNNFNLNITWSFSSTGKCAPTHTHRHTLISLRIMFDFLKGVLASINVCYKKRTMMLKIIFTKLLYSLYRMIYLSGISLLSLDSLNRRLKMRIVSSSSKDFSFISSQWSCLRPVHPPPQEIPPPQNNTNCFQIWHKLLYISFRFLIKIKVLLSC